MVDTVIGEGVPPHPHPHKAGQNLPSWWNVHRKKRFTSFPSPAGMSLTKLPLGRNNSVMTSFFPPGESLVVITRLGTGNSQTFFLRCTLWKVALASPFVLSQNQQQGFSEPWSPWSGGGGAYRSTGARRVFWYCARNHSGSCVLECKSGHRCSFSWFFLPSHPTSRKPIVVRLYILLHLNTDLEC